MNNRKRRRPTLRDVAQAAGVSIWTASNTFSNPDKVAPPTRDRVLAAADALDYHGPNPGARTLALGRSQMIAFATDGDAGRLLNDPAGALIAQGLLTTCDRAGFSLVLSGRHDHQLVDGRVLFRVGDTDGMRGPAIGIELDNGSVPSIRADTTGAAAAVADHLAGLGHRSIAVLAYPGGERRLDGAIERWSDIGELAVYRGGDDARWPTRADGEAAARAALQAADRPTALLALSDNLAMGAMEAAHRIGLRVPQDVSIAGIDDLPGSDMAGLTTAFVPYRPLGELAGDLLIGQLESGETPDVPPPVPTILTIRQSTAAPPARRRRR